MLAAMCICSKMVERGMCEEDEGEGGDVLLDRLELRGVEALVPSDIDEDFDTAVKFEEGLGGRRGGAGSEERSESQHLDGLSLSHGLLFSCDESN